MTPAIAVVANSARVIEGLASQTSLSTRGRAVLVPVTDCLKFSQRLRRSFGLWSSGGCSISGSPVRPLFAGPLSADFRLPNHQCIAGGPLPGPIIAISCSGAYPPNSNCTPLAFCHLLCNIVIMDEKELGSIKGWFAGRLPDGWFTGVDVTIEDDQIVVMSALADAGLGSTPEEKEGAAAGRIARFREETRGQRIGIAQEAEERFKKYVTWGVTMGSVTKRFNPGGGGVSSGDRRSVMIRRWMRRHRGRREQQAERQSQVF